MTVSISTGVFVAALLLVLLELVAGFLWQELLWGVHHLAFFPAPVRLAVCGVAIAGLGLIYWRREQLSSEVLSRTGCLGKSYYGIAALLSFLLFYFFRIRHWLFGDAFLIVGSGPLRPEFYFGGTNDSTFLSLVHRLFVGSTAGEEWSTTIALVSCAAGAIYVLCALYLADRLGQNQTFKAFAFIAIISTGALELFFGYVEEYTLMTVCVGLVWLCLIRWEGHRAKWLAAAAASAATAFVLHPVALFTSLPLVCAAGVQIRGWSRKFKYGTGVAIALGIALVLAGAAGFHWGTVGHAANLLAWENGETEYHLFSGFHLLDTLNLFLLLVPLHGALCGIVLWKARKQGWWRDPVLICLLTGTGAALATTFVIEPLLGSLDWDLLALYAVPCGVLTAYLVCRYVNPQDAATTMLYFAIGAFVHLIPWVAVNADEERGAAAVEVMTEKDFHHRGERNTKLGVKFQNTGMVEAAVRQYQKALRFDPYDPLAIYNLGMIYYAEGPFDEGLELFSQFLQVAPHHLDSRFIRSIVSFHQARRGAAISLCVDFLLDHPEHEKAQELAGFLRDQAQRKKDRLMLESALLFAREEHAGAVRICTELVKEYGDDAEVEAFARTLYGKFRSADDDG